MTGQRFISYLRVSTQRQGAHGLGIEAQRATVLQYVASHGGVLEREFVEVESGRHDDRPELASALHYAKCQKVKVIFAKVDRLARSTRFLLHVMDSGAEVVFCDLPQVDGPAGRLVLTLMAGIAEMEAGLISQRTKAALKAAKARGKRLGNPLGAAAFGPDAAKAARARADERARDLAPVVAKIRAAGVTSLHGIAKALNARGVKTARGAEWYAASVSSLLGRLATTEGRQECATIT